MRKLILISAFVLASVSAQAGQDRNLILAANDQPAAAETAAPAKPVAETAKAPEVQAPAAKAPEAKAPEAKAADVKAPEVTTDVKSSAAPEATKQAAKPARKTHARSYEGDEAKARRIAAKYGVYW